MTATLNSFISNIDKIKRYLSSCKQKNIKVLGPSINKSLQHFVCSEGVIRFGLEGIKGLGSSSELIVAEREANGPFKSYQDLLSRMAINQKINKKSIEALIYSGALDEFSGTRKEKIDQLEEALNFVKESKKVYSPTNVKILQTLGAESSEIQNVKLITKDGSMFSKKDMLNKEFEYTSFYITGHPLDDYTRFIKASNPVKLSSLTFVEDEKSMVEKENGQKVPISMKNLTFVGAITEVEEKISKKGNTYAEVTVEDKTGTLSVSFFNGYDTLKEFIKEGNCVSLRGKVQVDDNGNVRLLANDLQLLDETFNTEYKTVLISKSQYKAAMQCLRKFKEGECVVQFIDTFNPSNSFTLDKKYKIGTADLCKLQEAIGHQNIKAK